jgi:acyl carrier protein
VLDLRYTPMNNIAMNRDEFLLEMDEILDLPAGTLRGHERLEELQNWDSISLITFIALAESNNGVSISPAQIVRCSTVADLLRLAQAESSAS